MIDYEAVFKSTPALLLLIGVDPAFTLLDASDSYLKTSHTERDQIVGRPLFEVFPDNPDDLNANGAANLRASLLRVLKTGLPDTMAVQKYDVRRPDSEGGGFEARYWSPVNVPVLGPDGQIRFILQRVEEVTELARQSEGELMRLEVIARGQELQEANRQLREATEQFQAMYDQGLFAARLRLDGTVADINRSALEVCGFKREDVIGRPFWECGWWNLSPDVQVWVRNAVEQAVAGEPFRGESRYFWGDGSEHVVDFACMPVRDEDGRVVVVVPTGMDITERVQAEEHQRAFEAERRRAEALAEIDRSKTLFFSNVSHEFRTPLTLMLGPLEDVLGDADHPLEGVHRERLDMVLRNGLRLQKLVNALLDFSRAEAGRVRAVYEPTDLSALTRDLTSSFRAACDRAGLTLSIVADPLPEAVFVDREMWEKIVLNLVSNAFKFTFEGGIEVTVTADGPEAVLTVRDSGVGIPEPELPRIFDRFHRVAGARGRTHEGTGIGLALVRELVNQHGGRIHVDSRPDVGTIFEVRLPFGRSHLPEDRIETSRDQPSTAVGADAFLAEAQLWRPDAVIADDAEPAPSTQGAPPSILVADDNADMRIYLRRLLSPHYHVELAADGVEALASLRAARPDIVLADVMMPRLDGHGLLSAVRADPTLADLPVVLLSARAGQEATIEGLAAGADDYLVKPFSARELIARLSAKLERARSRRELRESEETSRRQAHSLAVLNESGAALAAELDLNRIVQMVTDAGVGITGAQFGAFFYNLIDEAGERYMLYALSGVDRSAFERFPMPRNTAVFAPTFNGEGVVKSDDITQDPRYGHNAPRRGMPEGHLPVRSYLAVPVVSRSGEVLGGLFFGHSEVAMFSDAAAELVRGVAGQAAVAIDNARLYQSAQVEIQQRRRIEDQQRLLINELNHRVKNTLATVQSIVAQTSRADRTSDQVRTAIEARLLALSAAHDLLTRHNWEGADLVDVVRRAMAPFSPTSSSRIRVSGPPIALNPQQSLAMSMALHELATNAAKYGALSVPEGWVSIDWTATAEAFELVWQEAGGPAIVEPTHRGFGTRLLQRGLARDLGGDVELEFRPAGLRCLIKSPQIASARPLEQAFVQT